MEQLDETDENDDDVSIRHQEDESEEADPALSIDALEKELNEGQPLTEKVSDNEDHNIEVEEIVDLEK